MFYLQSKLQSFQSFYYLWYLVEVRADSALGQVDDTRVPWDGHPAHHLREGGQLHVGAPAVHVLLASLNGRSRVCSSTLNIYINIIENLNSRAGQTVSSPVDNYCFLRQKKAFDKYLYWIIYLWVPVLDYLSMCTCTAFYIYVYLCWTIYHA